MVTVLSFLRQAKHRLIGSPSAKLAFKRDGIIPTIVTYVNISPTLVECSGDSVSDIRAEAANVIASLAHGSSETLQALFMAGAHEAVLFSISHLQPDDPAPLKTALIRCLRALAGAAADVVGPPLWGIEDGADGCMKEALQVLDYLFQTETMDGFLPMLTDPVAEIRVLLAQLLASSIRVPEHRNNVSEWMPIVERAQTRKINRGWENLDIGKGKVSRNGKEYWVQKNLAVMLSSKELKMQEAALIALAALIKDNPTAANSLLFPSVNVHSIVAEISTFLKSRNLDIQLAACLCLARVFRNPTQCDAISPSMLLHKLNDIIADSSAPESARTKACFILCTIVSDDKEQCHNAWKTGSLRKLSDLLKLITPMKKDRDDWGESEPRTISRLREAVLTAIAAISLFDNDIRNEVSGPMNLLPCIASSLCHPYIGVRYGACQCARSLSRTVAIIRTCILDTGIGIKVYEVVEKLDEDERVLNIALAAICNLVHNCSPLRTPLIERGLVNRLNYLITYGPHSLKFNALWAVKNLLYRTTYTEKKVVMDCIGWDVLSNYSQLCDSALEEQILNILCNLTTAQAEIDLVLANLTSETIMAILTAALESNSENVICQGMYTLANIANHAGEHRKSILSSGRILSSLRTCLTNRDADVRRAAVSCVKQLAQTSPHQHKELREAGIESTLRHLSVGDIVPGSHHWNTGMHSPEIREAVRFTLHLLDTPILSL